MRRAILIIGLALVLGTAGVGHAATATHRWRSGQTSMVPVITDGASVAVWQPDASNTAVWFPRTGRLLQLRTPAGLLPVAIGGGQLLWSAPPSQEQPVSPVVLHDLATGEDHVPVGLDAVQPNAYCNDMSDSSSIAISRVGSQGIAGVCETGRGAVDFRLNWRTGAYSVPWETRWTPRTIEDLDRPGLTRELCRPLTAPVLDDDPRRFMSDAGPILVPYDGRLAVTYDQWPLHPESVGRGLGLQRCGVARHVVLARGPVAQASLGAGRVSWMSIRRMPGQDRVRLADAHVLSPRSGTRATWAPIPLPFRLGGDASPQLAHTAERLFASIPTVGSATYFRVLIGMIPRASGPAR
jgi:hypothetical protein